LSQFQQTLSDFKDQFHWHMHTRKFAIKPS